MSDVATPSAEVDAMQSDWMLAAALMGGTRAMRAAGESLLPKWPNEDAKAYATRLATATLFPAYQRTVQTLTGKPFSKPITIGDDVPAQVLPLLDDVDLEGRNLDVFAADVMECALAYGLCGILVEYPTAEGIRTLADAQASGARPYWVHIKPSQFLGWRAKRVNGKWMIEQLRLMESVTEPDGDFGQSAIQQVRVLSPGLWQAYRKPSNGGDWTLFAQGLTSLNYVPFVPVYGQRTGYITGVPPLREMAFLNVQHWQSSSDQQTILHVARVPILAVIGVEDDTWSMTVGASAAVKLPQAADMKYVEHSGASIDAGRTSLQDLKEQMRQSGAELLVLDTKMTATQVSAENSVGMCALQRMASGLEDALDLALQYTADWIGAGEGGHVTLFSDYAAANLSDASEQIVLSAQQGGLISKATAINEMKRRGTLSAEVDPEIEAGLVDGDGPALGSITDEQPSIEPAIQPAAEPQAIQQAPAIDLAPLIEAIRSLQPAAPVQQQPTVINMTLPEQQAPVLNFTAAPVTVEGSTVNVTPPTVNVAAPEITVESPTVNVAAPVVNVEAAKAPEVTVPISVTVEKAGTVKFTENAPGEITGATIE